MTQDRKIAVIGGNSATADEIEFAEKTGQLLSENNYVVICGGGGGVMEAVCRGAVAVGGLTTGILPGTGVSDANQWVTSAIATGMGTSRNRIIVLSAEAVIAIGGRYGTLSEIAFALQADKPVCVFGKWENIDGVVSVSSPAEALEFILKETEKDYA